MVMTRIFPFYLKMQLGIESIDFFGEARLAQSIAAGNSILLAPNHSRSSDPMLLGILARKLNQPFHYMTNLHAFLENKIVGWIIRRLGGFSIFREGADRKALRVSRDLLILGTRPLVIFPEGEVSRTNDYLCPFMRGLGFVVKTATQALARQEPAPKLVVHPIAIKYILVRADEEALHKVLDRIESHYHWTKSKLPLIKRIAKVGKSLLELKEMEYLGRVQRGELSGRVHQLKEHLIIELESQWLSSKPRSCFMSRVNSLRAVILAKLLTGGDNESQLKSKRALGTIDLAVRLSNYPLHYLQENVTLEKITETVQRMEEDVLHRERIHGRWKARVQIGEGIELKADVPTIRELSSIVFNCIQMMLDLLGKPMPAWI